MRHTKLFTIRLALLLIAGVLFGTSPVSPLPKHVMASAAFDPDNLISNTVFTADTAMSESDIQNFLQSKGSVLATLDPSLLGANANGRSAAQIIYDATRATFKGGVYEDDINNTGYAGYKPTNPLSITINPQVVLATLQKEQSLITIQNQAGLSSFSLTEAMGMGCPDTGGCSADFAGFTNQVDMATAQLMINYVGSSNCPWARAGNTWPKSTTNGNPVDVYISNAATAALYCYTPHIYQGNYNFWLTMQTWFPDSVNAFSPVAQILQGSGPALYAYWPAQNEKWPIENIASISAWGISSATQTMTDAQITAIPNGTGQLSQLVKGSGDAVYYVSNGAKSHVRTDTIFPTLGVSWSDLSTIDDTLLNQLRNGAPLGTLSQSSISPNIYLLTANRKYYVNDGSTIANWGFTWNDVDPVSESEIDARVSGPTLGFLVQGENSPDLYAVSNGTRLHIDSMAIFSAWGFNLSNVATIGFETSAGLPIGADLTQLVKGSGSTVYYIANGKKRHVTSFSHLASVGLSQSQLVTVSDYLLNSLPSGSDL